MINFDADWEHHIDQQVGEEPVQRPIEEWDHLECRCVNNGDYCAYCEDFSEAFSKDQAARFNRYMFRQGETIK